MRHLVHAAAVMLVALVPAGCTGDETSDASRPSTAPSTAAAPQTAEEAVEALMAAWREGDREAASLVARPAAIDALFAHEPLDASLVGCFAQAGQTACELVDTRQRSLQVEVGTVASAPRVESLAFVGGEAALPRDPESYAAALVDAWAAWDKDLALRYATAETVTRLFAFDSADGWTLRMTDGAAGTSFPTYEDEQGRTIALEVSNAAVSEGRTQGVTGVLLPGDEGLVQEPAPLRPSGAES